MLDLNTFLRLCRQYANLGGSIQDQLERAAQSAPLEEQNGSALRAIAEFLRSADGLVDGAGEMAEEIEIHLNPDRNELIGARRYDEAEEEGAEADPDFDCLADDTEPAGGYERESRYYGASGSASIGF